MLTALALSFLFSSQPILAQEPQETWIVQGAPTESQIAEWSALPGRRSFLFQLEDPAPWSIEPIARLRGADRIRLEFTRYPGEDSLAALTRLGAQGIDLVILDAGFPTEDEIARLNRLPSLKAVFIVTGYPGEDDGRRLKALKGQFSLTFVTRAYPRFVDKPAFLSLPESTPLQFATDYWPWYSHMDLFNLFPQPLSLRVKDMYPPDEELQYLLNIKRLRSVLVDSDFEPGDRTQWEKLGALDVKWSARGRMPSEEALRAFEASRSLGLRKLVIDSDTPLTKQELARLRQSPLETEWIHAAPYSF